MVIRKATIKDKHIITKLIRAYPDKLLQDHLPPWSAFFVAIEDGRIVGCAALDIYSQRLAEIRSVAVDREFYGYGVSRRLIDACIDRAKERGIYEVLSITSAAHMFERHGFDTLNQEKFALFKVLQ